MNPLQGESFQGIWVRPSGGTDPGPSGTIQEASDYQGDFKIILVTFQLMLCR